MINSGYIIKVELELFDYRADIFVQERQRSTKSNTFSHLENMIFCQLIYINGDLSTIKAVSFKLQKKKNYYQLKESNFNIVK